MLDDWLLPDFFVTKLGGVHDVKNRFLATVHQEVGAWIKTDGGTEVLVIRCSVA